MAIKFETSNIDTSNLTSNIPNNYEIKPINVNGISYTNNSSNKVEVEEVDLSSKEDNSTPWWDIIGNWRHGIEVIGNNIGSDLARDSIINSKNKVFNNSLYKTLDEVNDTESFFGLEDNITYIDDNIKESYDYKEYLNDGTIVYYKNNEIIKKYSKLDGTCEIYNIPSINNKRIFLTDDGKYASKKVYTVNGLSYLYSDNNEILEYKSNEKKEDFNLIDSRKRGIEVIGNALGKTKTFQVLNKTGIVDVYKNIEATKGNVLTGIAKGIFKTGESLVDTLALAGGVVCTIPTGIIDSIGYLTGNDLGMTNGLWNNFIKPTVKCEVIDNIYSAYYSDYGKVMNDSAYDCFKTDGTGFNVCEMIGSVLGVLASGEVFTKTTGLFSKTSNLSSSIFAGLSGIGKGTSEAWNEDANIIQGLGYGLLTGGFDFFQYWIGGKISEISIGSGKSILGKIGNIGLKSILSGLDGGADTPVRALFKLIYSDKNYIDNFNMLGGWNSVITQFLLGTAISGGVETTKEVSNFIHKPKFNYQDYKFYEEQFADLYNDIKNNFPDNEINILKSTLEVGESNVRVDKYLNDKNIIESMPYEYRSRFVCNTLMDEMMHDESSRSILQKCIESKNYKLLPHEIREFPREYIDDYLKNYKEILNGKYVVSENDFFKSMDNYELYDYGVDQACISNLCDYEFNGKIYNYKQARRLRQQCIENGLPAPNFIEYSTDSYVNLQQKLIDKGYAYSKESASAILNSVDHYGACSYASVCNEIFDYFSDNPNEFKNIFGYDMYINYNGYKFLNSPELLLDLYLFANDTSNGGQIFDFKIGDFSKYDVSVSSTDIDVLGNSINSDSMMKYLSGANHDESTLINKFLKSKNASLEYNSEITSSPVFLYTSLEFTDLLKTTSNNLKNGNSIRLGIYQDSSPIRFINDVNTFSTANWNEGGGHSVKITGMTNDSFICSSWGQRFQIPYSDLFNSGNFNIVTSKITNNLR